MTPQTWLARFREDSNGMSPHDRADALWPQVRREEFVRDWLHACVIDMAQETVPLPPGYSDPTVRSLVLFDDGDVHLSLAMFDAQASCADRSGQDTLEFADGWTRLWFVRADRVEAQRICRTDTPQAGVRRDPPRQVRPGQEFLLDNASEILRFTAIGGACIFLRLLVRNPMQRHAVEHDAASGAIVRIRQAQAHEGRLQMTLSLLRSLGRADAIDTIADKPQSWPPDLRWHGVREALALDSRRGFALLEAMSREDPDPMLRALARETRDRLLQAYPQLGEIA